MTLLLRIKRQLGIVPPADGLCTFVREVHVQETGFFGFRDYIEVMRCREAWHHKGEHKGEIEREAS